MHDTSHLCTALLRAVPTSRLNSRYFGNSLESPCLIHFAKYLVANFFTLLKKLWSVSYSSFAFRSKCLCLTAMLCLCDLYSFLTRNIQYQTKFLWGHIGTWILTVPRQSNLHTKPRCFKKLQISPIFFLRNGSYYSSCNYLKKFTMERSKKDDKTS